MYTAGAETEIFKGNQISTMAADALIPSVATASETMVLNILDKRLLVFHKEITHTVSVLKKVNNVYP